MAPFTLFRRSKPKEAEMAAEQTNASAQAPLPKRPVVTLGLDSNGRWRGIFRDERIHVAIVGFPGCGKSVSYDCKILVYDSFDKWFYYIPIGMFAHNFLAAPHEECYLRLGGRFYTLAVSPNGKVAWKKVTAAHVHRSPRKLIHIQTRSGCSITVTDDHSLMSVEGGVIKPVRAGLLKLGDTLLKPSRIPPLQLEEHCIDCLPLNEDLARLLGYYVSEGSQDKCLARISGVSYTTDWRNMSEERDSITILDIANSLGLLRVGSSDAVKTIMEVKEKLCPNVGLGYARSANDVKRCWKFSTISTSAKKLVDVYQTANLEAAENGIAKLHELADLEVWFDQIESIQVVDSTHQFVYDLSVEDYENFYAEGIFAHNSRFLLSLAIQDVWNGYGVMLVDPHGDLAKIFLSHIPKKRWKDVIYIDPITARKYGAVVKVNFLECREPKDRDVVARSFMESLEKIYHKYWGPRLDMILMNAIYTLLDSSNTNLSNLYSVIADESFRQNLLQKVSDEKIRSFWESEFKKMAKDAGSAALTKIYRIVQERIVAPMFDCARSSIDFREAMDEGKIIAVNLSEGAITSDVANFLGSLILARVYLAGMSREDTPEDQRVPFYVYVDEAYRFVSLSIRDILQSLRKYHVYMTLASQYLGQYSKEIAESIPHLCDTIMCFTVGEDTAKALEEFYRPPLNYLDLVHLPKFTIAVSTVVGGSRECQILRTVDLGWGQTDVEELIKFSLGRYGEFVDVSRYTGVPAYGDLPHPTSKGINDPLEWITLVKLYGLYEENLGSGCPQFIGHDDLVGQLKGEFPVEEASIQRALNSLAFAGYIQTRDKEYDFSIISLPVEAPAVPTPVECSSCHMPTCRPFILRSGRTLCKFCAERGLADGSVKPSEVVQPEISPEIATDLRNAARLRATKKFYAITPLGRKRFPEGMVPRGARGGGTDHVAVIGSIARKLVDEYFYVIIDTGEEAVKKAEGGKEEYVTKSLPDIVAWPVARNKDGKLNVKYWDTAHAFTVEVEINPIKHKQRVINNLKKNENWGRPVTFATPKLKWAIDLYDIIKGELGREVVEDNTGLYGGTYNPRVVRILCVDPAAQIAVTQEKVDVMEKGLDPELRKRLLEEAEEEGVEARLPPKEPGEAQKPLEEKPAETQATATPPPVTPAATAPRPSLETAEKRVVKEARVEEAGGLVEKASVELEFKSVKQLISVLSRDGWGFRRYVDGADVVYAEKKAMGGDVVRFKIGPYESLKETLRLLNIQASTVRVEEKPAAEPTMPITAPQRLAKELVEQRGVKPEAKVAEKRIEAPHAGAATPLEATPAAGEAPSGEQLATPDWKSLSHEERLRVAHKLQYKFYAKRKHNTFEIYAQKWLPEKKIQDKPYIGTWNEKLKKLAEELQIKIYGLEKKDSL